MSLAVRPLFPALLEKSSCVPSCGHWRCCSSVLSKALHCLLLSREWGSRDVGVGTAGAGEQSWCRAQLAWRGVVSLSHRAGRNHLVLTQIPLLSLAVSCISFVLGRSAKQFWCRTAFSEAQASPRLQRGLVPLSQLLGPAGMFGSLLTKRAWVQILSDYLKRKHDPNRYREL